VVRIETGRARDAARNRGGDCGGRGGDKVCHQLITDKSILSGHSKGKS